MTLVALERLVEQGPDRFGARVDALTPAIVGDAGEELRLHGNGDALGLRAAFSSHMSIMREAPKPVNAPHTPGIPLAHAAQKT